MNDPRDFLTLARFGNLGVLLLGIGLLGVLIHRKPARQAIAAGVGLLGILLICEGASLFHHARPPLRGSVVFCLTAAAAGLFITRSLLRKTDENERSSR